MIQFLGRHLHFKYHFDACKLWSRNLVPSLGRWSRLLFLPLLSSVFYENQYLSAGKEDFSSRNNNIPCIFLPLNGKKSNISHEFANDRKNLQAWSRMYSSIYTSLAWWSFDTICFENKPEVKPIEWPIFRVLPLIFLRLFSLLIHIFCLYARCPFCLFV